MRPKIFKSKKALQEAIDNYFNDMDQAQRPYTLSGLAYYLEIDRKTLYNYGKDDKFFPTVKRAREKIEMQLEENLVSAGNATTGIIFNLKNNYGWTDKVVQEHEGDIFKGVEVVFTK